MAQHEQPEQPAPAKSSTIFFAGIFLFSVGAVVLILGVSSMIYPFTEDPQYAIDVIPCFILDFLGMVTMYIAVMVGIHDLLSEHRRLGRENQ